MEFVHWVDMPEPGRLGILPHPDGGEDIHRSIEELRGSGVDVLVSALESDEALLLGLGDEGEACEAASVVFHALPIPDWGIPRHPKPVIDLARKLGADLAEGRSVAIHCRAGIGRSALLAATVLTLLGWEPGLAFSKLGKARGLLVPATPEQRLWVESVASGELRGD